MTDTLIKEQIKIIEEATKAASQSKETATKFLEDAGIIKKETPDLSSSSKVQDKKIK